MKGHKIGKKFVSAILKVSSYSLLFVVVAVGSYYVTTSLYQEKAVITLGGSNQTRKEIKEATLDQVATNVIFAVNQETAVIEHIVLEVFNSTTKNFDFVTIPVSAQLTMDQELYTELLEVNSNIPQILTLSDITQYFDQTEAYEYASIILEEVLGSKISFYTAMITSDFEEYFDVGNGKTEITSICKVKEEVLQQMDAFQSEEEVLEALTAYYKKVQSNLSLSRRQSYIKYYLSGNYDYVYYHLVAGESQNGVYEIATEAAAEQISSLINNEVMYSNEQTEIEVNIEEQAEATKQRTIHILNASQISGLAARYESQLKTEGYQITYIGNYSGEVLETTRIIVREEGIGGELLSYFHDAELEVDPTQTQSDITIILGTKDA